jgi:phosphoglycolate phosphatase-like HAD superfamily hydrolase
MRLVRAMASGARLQLRGVVFDMDGTLTVPNLDFPEMYRRAGVPMGADILSSQWRSDANVNAVIEEMEAAGRRTLQLMPGAAELGTWLHSHGIPMALVTRNSAATVSHFMENVWPSHLPPLSLAISRDDGFPPKPDPSALLAISKSWGVESCHALLMVGDSPANDILFGKAAGLRTALLDTGRRNTEGGTTAGADYVVDNLAQIARHVWESYDLASHLKDPEMHAGKPPPAALGPAHVAAAAGDTQALASMSSQKLQGVCLQTGNTPLIWAADMGHLKAVELLLEAEVPLNIRGYLGATALCRAARRGHLPVLKALLAQGADADLPNMKLQYPLHFAAFKRKQEIVRELVRCGANVWVLDRKGRTPAEDTGDAEIRSEIRQAQALSMMPDDGNDV